MTEGTLTFDSVYRFKGQEAPAVILVDMDPRAERLEREERLPFCGMTRATVRLELVVNRENDYNRRFIGNNPKKGKADAQTESCHLLGRNHSGTQPRDVHGQSENTLTELKPRDTIDVQSFMWCILPHKS